MRFALAIALALSALSVHAQATRTTPLTGTEIRNEIIGLTLDGEYQDGMKWRERLGTDGTSVYEQDGAVAKGTISFRGPRICFTYENEFSGGCFEVWRRSFNCFDFYSLNDDGTLGATAMQRRNGIGWTARAWRADQPSTCVSDQIA